MLILGGSATVTDLTGMSTIAVRALAIFSADHQILTPFGPGMLLDSARCSNLRCGWWHASYVAM